VSVGSTTVTRDLELDFTLLVAFTGDFKVAVKLDDVEIVRSPRSVHLGSAYPDYVPEAEPDFGDEADEERGEI
jgi:hypothetical protein